MQEFRQLRMKDAAAEFDRSPTDDFKSGGYLLGQHLHVAESSVRQTAFRLGPDSLIGIELRRIARKIFHMQACHPSSEFPERFSFMDPSIIQKNHDRSTQMAQELAEEIANVETGNIALLKSVVKPQALNPRADRDRRDDRHFVTAHEMPEQRRLAAGGPGLHDIGNQEEPRFIKKNEVGAQPRSVFFTCGQRHRFHSWMASSFRSIARRSGFWWLQPRLCIIRPT